jgi:hypothetical protein
MRLHSLPQRELRKGGNGVKGIKEMEDADAEQKIPCSIAFEVLNQCNYKMVGRILRNISSVFTFCFLQ